MKSIAAEEVLIVYLVWQLQIVFCTRSSFEHLNRLAGRKSLAWRSLHGAIVCLPIVMFVLALELFVYKILPNRASFVVGLLFLGLWVSSVVLFLAYQILHCYAVRQPDLDEDMLSLYYCVRVGCAFAAVLSCFAGGSVAQRFM